MADTLFTYGPSNATKLLATTISSYSKTMTDNIYNSQPLLALLYMKHRVTTDGGASIIRPVMYAKNSTASFYESDDIIDTTIQDNFTAAQFQWRQAAASVSIPGRIDRQNAGSSEMVNYVNAEIQAAELSIKDKIGEKLWAASQLGKNITPLPAIVSTSGSVGDISGTTSSWWQSKVATSVGSFAANGLSQLRTVWNALSVRNPIGGPDALISDQTSFEAYEATLVPAVRFSDAKMGDLGFLNYTYKGSPWTFDPNATSGAIYMLHSPSLELIVNEGTSFVLSEWVKPAAQDLKVAQVLWMGELGTRNRRKLGSLTGVTA